MLKKTAFLFTLLVCSAFSSAFDWQRPEIISRLWKISKPDQPDSYLVGTFHLGKPDSTLPAKLNHILKQSDLLVSEVIPPVNPSRAVVQDIRNMQNQMLDLTSGQTLSDKIGAENVAKLAERLRSNPNTRPFADKLPQTEPWAAVMLEVSARPAGYDSQYGLDYLLSQAAVRYGIKQSGLERYNDLPIPFKKLPLARIIEQIDFSNRYQKESQDFLKKMIDLYYSGRYNELIRISTDRSRYADMPDVSEASIRYWRNWLEQDLLVSRNQQWLPKLLSLLPKQKTLIAVGTAHLVDDSGLILQLRRHGYTVEPVSE